MPVLTSNPSARRPAASLAAVFCSWNASGFMQVYVHGFYLRINGIHFRRSRTRLGEGASCSSKHEKHTAHSDLQKPLYSIPFGTVWASPGQNLAAIMASGVSLRHLVSRKIFCNLLLTISESVSANVELCYFSARNFMSGLGLIRGRQVSRLK